MVEVPSAETNVVTLSKASKKVLKDLRIDKLPQEKRCEALLAKVMGHIELLREADEKKLRIKERTEDLLPEIEKLRVEEERGKAMSSKLEALCESLKAQIESLIEESHQYNQAEKARLTDFTENFQEKMTDVKREMEEHMTARIALVEEGNAIRQRFRDVAANYELREKQLIEEQKKVELKIQHLSSERDVLEAQCIKQAEETQAEKLLNHQYLEEEAAMKLQLKKYREKFGKFQETLDKSTAVFDSFKKETERLQKHLGRLRKDNANYKASTKKIAARSEKATKIREELEESEAQVLKRRDVYEKICKDLQKERGDLAEQLKDLRARHDERFNAFIEPQQ